MKEKVILEVNRVTFSYAKTGEETVLQNISFSLAEGEALGLIGANGVGKSTLLKLLVGLELEYRGEILVDSVPVSKKTLADVRKHIGYIFQDSDSQLFMRTVREDVAFAPRNYGMSVEEVERRTSDALKQTGIEHLADKPVYQLSGGEKKLASIATILSLTPGIILMDEPSAALDPKNRRHLIQIVNSLPQTKLIASHDLDFIWDTCSRVILMDKGEVAADGPSQEILRDEALLLAHGLELPLSLQSRRR